MRKLPWMVEVARQRPVGILHPYTVRFTWRGMGWRRVSSSPRRRLFCAQNGVAREVRLELAFSRYEVYEGKVREVHRPKGLLAYAAAAREYVRML